MRSLLARLLGCLGGIAIWVSPAVAAQPGDDINSYPLADGLSKGYYGSVSPPGTSNFPYGSLYFTAPNGWSCGIAPNGGPIGCDAVPSTAPPGTNQTFADASLPAEYRHSDAPIFTRDAPVLPAGQRLQTIGASCAVDYQGAVHCKTEGNHGFVLSADAGVLW